MDIRAMHFVALLVFSGVTSLVQADLNDTTTVQPANPSITGAQNSVQSTASKPSAKQSVSTVTSTGQKNSPVTQAPASTTTPAPLNCRIGVCNGTDLNATKCKNLASNNPCKSGDSCAVVQTNLNDTYSSFNFSCAVNCNSLLKEGRKVACCTSQNCTPDLSKPIQNNNGGVATIPLNVVSFLSLILMSVLVI